MEWSLRFFLKILFVKVAQSDDFDGFNPNFLRPIDRNYYGIVCLLVLCRLPF